MTGRAHPAHVAPEELLDYFGGQLGEERGTAIAGHLASCGECRESAQQIDALSAAWDRWTAQAHGEACGTTAASPRALLLRALDRLMVQAEAVNQELRERFHRWREGSEGAVRVVLGAAGSASHILTDGLEPLLNPAATWRAFVPVPVGGPALRIRTRGGAVRTRGAIKPAPITVETVRTRGSAIHARVSVDLAARTIAVSVENFPRRRTPPMALLVPVQEGLEPQFKKLQVSRSAGPRSKTVDLYTEFSGVEEGAYLLSLEPISPERRH